MKETGLLGGFRDIVALWDLIRDCRLRPLSLPPFYKSVRPSENCEEDSVSALQSILEWEYLKKY